MLGSPCSPCCTIDNTLFCEPFTRQVLIGGAGVIVGGPVYEYRVTLSNIEPQGAGLTKLNSDLPWLDTRGFIASGTGAATPTFVRLSVKSGVAAVTNPELSPFLTGRAARSSDIRYTNRISLSRYAYQNPYATIATAGDGCLVHYGSNTSGGTGVIAWASLSTPQDGWAIPWHESFLIIDRQTRAGRFVFNATGRKNFSGGTQEWFHTIGPYGIATGLSAEVQIASLPGEPFQESFTGVQCANLFTQSWTWTADVLVECVQIQ
jgi:hypothetical protein